MELALFLEKFKDCFVQTPPDGITEKTAFRQLEEWNSMMALIVIAMVDSDFNKVLTADNIRNAVTVEDLFNCISKN